MQVESLKLFCDVVDHVSFSKAAEANHVTQSAASQIVSQLEKRLGVLLINRGRPLKLTDAGQKYYDGCKDLVKQYMELEAEIRNAPPELPLTVQVAAIYSVGLGDMGQYVECFEAHYPYVRVQIEYLHPARVYEKVLDGTADFGLVSFPRRSRELRTLLWREEEMLLTCSPQHPLARCPAIHPEQLAGEKYVGFSKDLTIRRKVDQFCASTTSRSRSGRSSTTSRRSRRPSKTRPAWRCCRNPRCTRSAGRHAGGHPPAGVLLCPAARDYPASPPQAQLQCLGLHQTAATPRNRCIIQRGREGWFGRPVSVACAKPFSSPGP